MQSHHLVVIAVQHPARLLGGVRKHVSLVAVIRVDRVVAIEVIRTEVRHHADGRFDAGCVVQLEAGALEGSPRGLRLAQREFGQRGADVAGIDDVRARTQDVTNQCGGGGLAIGAGDRDVAQRRHGIERDLHLADHGDVVRTRGHARWRGRRHAWARDDDGRAPDAHEVVRACLHVGSERAQLRRVLQHLRGAPAIGCIDHVTGTQQQLCDRHAGPGQAKHGDLAGRALEAREQCGTHRTFSVPNARKAHRMPMIQNRTTTCVSGQPFISK